MAIDKSLKVIKGMLKEFPNLSLERIEQGLHYKLYLNTPCGVKLLIVSRTASDFRAVRNNRSLLRQWAQGGAK
jgi:hypothetical protein